MPTPTKTRPRRSSPPPPPPDSVKEDTILPEPEKRNRTPKLEKLESAVAGLYIMGGGAISTLPEQVGGTRLKMVGLNIAKSSDEIAEAWIDLAEDDKRVLKALESLTSFSGWGKVIGVHLMAVGSAVPGIAAAMPQQPQQSQGQSSGMDIQTQMIVAEMFRQAQSQQRQRFEDEPEVMEQIRREQQAPQEQRTRQQQQPQQQQQQQPVRRPGQAPPTRPGRNAGIPSAADLGVTIPDASVEFPTAGPENIRG